MKNKIAIIGGGNLGSAIAEGLLKSKFCKAADIHVTKRNTATLKNLEAKGIHTGSDNAAAVKQSELVILAVKPYQVSEVLNSFKKELSHHQKEITGLQGHAKYSHCHTGKYDLHQRYQRNRKTNGLCKGIIFRVG